MDAPSLSYRRFAANVLAGGSARVAAIVTALVLATALVHILGLSAYGTWAFFFVLIGYHGQFDLGLSVAVERAVARAAGRGDTARIDALLNAGLAMSVVLSALLQALAALPLPDAWLARVGEAGAVRDCVRVLPACLLCSNVAAVAGAGLTGLQRTTTLALQRTLMGAATALVVIALAVAGVHRLDALLAAYSLGLLATAALSWRAVRNGVAGLRFAPWRVTADTAGELARVGGTLQATHLVAQAGDQGLRVVLGSAYGAAAIGVYDLASRAAIAPRSLMASLLVALVPFAAAREDSGGRAALSDSLRRTTRYATLAIAAGTITGLSVAGAVHDAVARRHGAGHRSTPRRIFELLLVALARAVDRPARWWRWRGPPATRRPRRSPRSLAQPLALVIGARAHRAGRRRRRLRGRDDRGEADPVVAG